MTKQTLQSLILVRGIKNKVFVGYEEDGHGTRDPVLYRVGNVLDGGLCRQPARLMITYLGTSKKANFCLASHLYDVLATKRDIQRYLTYGSQYVLHPFPSNLFKAHWSGP